MIEYDSIEERYFVDWLNELQEGAYVNEWERITTPISLTKGLTHSWNETVTLKTKRKTVPKSQVLLRASEYTPDFGILWSPYSIDIFFQPLGHEKKITCPFISHSRNNVFYSYVEIKADWDYKNMTRGFVNNQKVVWDKHGKFINLIKIGELFKETFAPASYFKTPTGLERKFSKGKPLNYQQFHDQI